MDEKVLYSILQHTCPKSLRELADVLNTYKDALKETCYGQEYAFYAREINPSGDDDSITIPRTECDVLLGFMNNPIGTDLTVQVQSKFTIKIGDYTTDSYLYGSQFSYADRGRGILPLVKLKPKTDVQLIGLKTPIYAICAVLDNSIRRKIMDNIDGVFFLRDDVHKITSGRIVAVEDGQTS